jgi:hypothetical protein
MGLRLKGLMLEKSVAGKDFIACTRPVVVVERPRMHVPQGSARDQVHVHREDLSSNADKEDI